MTVADRKVEALARGFGAVVLVLDVAAVYVRLREEVTDVNLRVGVGIEELSFRSVGVDGVGKAGRTLLGVGRLQFALGNRGVRALVNRQAGIGVDCRRVVDGHRLGVRVVLAEDCHVSRAVITFRGSPVKFNRTVGFSTSQLDSDAVLLHTVEVGEVDLLDVRFIASIRNVRRDFERLAFSNRRVVSCDVDCEVRWLLWLSNCQTPVNFIVGSRGIDAVVSGVQTACDAREYHSLTLTLSKFDSRGVPPDRRTDLKGDVERPGSVTDVRDGYGNFLVGTLGYRCVSSLSGDIQVRKRRGRRCLDGHRSAVCVVVAFNGSCVTASISSTCSKSKRLRG